MQVEFRPETHKYVTIGDENREWTSVTTLIGRFSEPFDAPVMAERCSKKNGSKWFGMDPQEIIAIWDRENKRSTDLGSWYHDQRENDVLGCNTISVNGIDLPIYRSEYVDGKKVSPSQELVDGVYPEHMMYLDSHSICGQSDVVSVSNGVVSILDYKSCKKIDLESVKGKGGKKIKMLPPVQHLDDCNFYHYSLQLSMYMYMALKHNPKLKPGKLTLQHVIFEVAQEDAFGYPILRLNEMGDPIVKNVINYDCPYLKKEIENILKYIKIKR